MNLLIRLEKSKVFWDLIFLSLLFFLLRFPSLIEPYWYGDEGIYETIGLAVSQGKILYSQIWDNKPPLLYLTYALFGGDQFGVRLLSLFFGLATIVLFYFLTQKLFKNHRISLLTTGLLTLLFGTPIIEGNIANAENFILLPVVGAALLIYSSVQKQKIKRATLIKNSKFWAGLLLGIAFMFKIVAVFDFAAFLVFLFILAIPKHTSKRELQRRLVEFVRSVLPYIIGFLLPFLIAIAYFTFNHALAPFFQAAFAGNVGYVGYGNTFIIPQGLLILKSLLLLAAVVLLYAKRNIFSQGVLFSLLWLIFSLFDAFFSQRPYTHYVLVTVPTICLFAGFIYYSQILKYKVSAAVIFITVVVLLIHNFHINSMSRMTGYYQNAFQFLSGKKSVTDYQAFFDAKTPRDYAVASFITSHTSAQDHVFIWGDDPAIYILAHKIPPGRYTVAYHITQNKNGINDTQAAINSVKPKYVISLSEAPLLPFSLQEYNSMQIKGATIYERTE